MEVKSTVLLFRLEKHWPIPLQSLRNEPKGAQCRKRKPMQISQEADKVVWYSHLFKNFPQFVMIHTVKVFRIVNEQKWMFFWNSLDFSMIQQMLTI